ncbi:histone acetyltransferase KAT6A-like [Halichondria panicea]|uniref:histone acetyltransferase KAT6A-like n=1 Tax=Halichondria panicea TaxID=6063 RepID=UPI00312B67DA
MKGCLMKGACLETINSHQKAIGETTNSHQRKTTHSHHSHQRKTTQRKTTHTHHSHQRDPQPPKRDDPQPPKRDDPQPPERDDQQPPKKEDPQPPERDDPQPPKRDPKSNKCKTKDVFKKTKVQWVNELSLTAHDREILLAPTGMLSDKHVDAAMILLSGQFSKTSGLQSSLKVQFRLGFRPIDLDKRTRVRGFKECRYCLCQNVITGS